MYIPDIKPFKPLGRVDRSALTTPSPAPSMNGKLLRELEGLEVTLFGQVQKGALGQRTQAVVEVADQLRGQLEQAEVTVYGQVQPGSLTERMERIDRDLHGEKSKETHLDRIRRALYGAETMANIEYGERAMFGRVQEGDPADRAAR